MPIIDFSGGNYRDSLRGMTLKALQDRQNALATQTMQASQPTQIRSPWQGAAGMLDALNAGMRENINTQALSSGRQRMAELLAGGLNDPKSMAEAITLDPDTAMKYQEQQWANQNQAQQFAHQDVTAAKLAETNAAAAAAQVAANKDTAATLETNKRADAATEHGYALDTQQQQARIATEKANLDATLGTDDAKWQAGLKAGTVSQQAYDLHTKELEGKAAQEAPSQYTAVTPEIAARYGPESDVAQHPGLYQIDTKTGQVSRIDQNAFANMPPGARSADEDFAKQDNEWTATGRSTAVANNAILDRALTTLRNAPNNILFQPSGPIIGQLPDALNKLINPDLTNTRDAVRTVAQSSLKALLGSQFTEREGQMVMDRAFDPTVSPQENIRRVGLLKAKLQQVQDNTEAKHQWWQTHHTLSNYQGPSLADDQASFLKLLDDFQNVPTQPSGSSRPTGTTAVPGTNTGTGAGNPNITIR